MTKQHIDSKSIYWSHDAIRNGLVVFIVLRILLSAWGFAVTAINPPQIDDPNLNIIEQMLGQPVLDEGAAKLLLSPWQRFDGMRYARIAAEGYANEEDSVFMPLYPLGMRFVGKLFGGTHASFLLAGIIISNVAFIALFALLYRVTELEIGQSYAQRTIVYLAVFPASFFLLAPYSESLFLLLALGSLWSGRNGRFWLAGTLGFFASLTRLMGWILVIPLAYELWQQQLGNGRWRTALKTRSPKQLGEIFAVTLPGIAMVLFIIYRQVVGLLPLDQLYATYWHQSVGIPGIDIWRGIQAVFFGIGWRAGSLAMMLDLSVALLLFITTILAFRYLPRSWGLYAATMLFFILLPASPLKPLYSFSRYALPFFTLFFILGLAGKRPFIHRLILYPSFFLLLLFSAIFFMWGFVA